MHVKRKKCQVKWLLMGTIICFSRLINSTHHSLAKGAKCLSRKVAPGCVAKLAWAGLFCCAFFQTIKTREKQISGITGIGQLFSEIR